MSNPLHRWSCYSSHTCVCVCVVTRRDFSIPQFAHRAVDTVCKTRWNCTASRHDHGGHLTPVYKRCRRCTARITAVTTPIRGGCAKMRIKSTDERTRLWENLCEATGESARSKALDRAARYYLRMCGGVVVWLHTDAVTSGRCSMKPKPRAVSRRRRSQPFSMSVSCQ